MSLQNPGEPLTLTRNTSASVLKWPVWGYSAVSKRAPLLDLVLKAWTSQTMSRRYVEPYPLTLSPLPHPPFPPAMSAAGSPQLAPPPDNNPPKDRSILLAVRALGVSAGVVGLCGIVYSVYFFLSLISVVNGANFVFRVPRFLHTKPCWCTCFLSAWMCVFILLS